MWLETNGLSNIKTATDINKLFENNKSYFSDIGHYRGGYNLYGSPIWSDIREYSNLDKKYIDKDIIQIVGHTQLSDGMVKFKNIYCIDSRQPFVITKKNKVKPYKK